MEKDLQKLKDLMLEYSVAITKVYLKNPTLGNFAEKDLELREKFFNKLNNISDPEGSANNPNYKLLKELYKEYLSNPDTKKMLEELVKNQIELKCKDYFQNQSADDFKANLNKMLNKVFDEVIKTPESEAKELYDNMIKNKIKKAAEEAPIIKTSMIFKPEEQDENPRLTYASALTHGKKQNSIG